MLLEKERGRAPVATSSRNSGYFVEPTLFEDVSDDGFSLARRGLRAGLQPLLLSGHGGGDRAGQLQSVRALRINFHA